MENEKTLLVQEVAKWRNRALEACERACWHCEEYISKHDCEKCRITEIRKAAEK